jgi:hypothetical protein
MMDKDRKFERGQRVLIKAVIGPSGVTSDGGVFVSVNTEDPEIWVHVSDIVPLSALAKKSKLKRVPKK